jgi:hypothetical protein
MKSKISSTDYDQNISLGTIYIMDYKFRNYL